MVISSYKRLTLKIRDILIPIGVGLVTPVICAVVVYFTMLAYAFYHAPMSDYDGQKQFLHTFQTATVDVVFRSSSLDNIFGYDQAAFRSIALEKISEQYHKQFYPPKIALSKEGAPYSFQTNPLNLKIIFEIYKMRNHPTFSVNVSFERSVLFGMVRVVDDPNLKKRIAAVHSNKSKMSAYYYIDLNLKSREPWPIRSKEELLKKIELLASEIVQVTDPEEKTAAEIEEKFKKRAMLSTEAE